MKITVNKTIITTATVLFLISALIYNLLYINNKKNEIIEEINVEETIEETKQEAEKLIYVDVSGCVENPGLYALPEGARVNDAIVTAGGVTDKGDLTKVNLAYILTDAMKVTIPGKEVKTYISKSPASVPKPVISTTIDMSADQDAGLININTADAEKLKELTGIGEATANKIIDYRNKNGEFGSIEDIKNVSGIGEAKFKNIKGKITV